MFDRFRIIMAVGRLSGFTLRRNVLVAAGLLSLLAVTFYLIENVRGRLAWRRALTVLQEAGETLEVEALRQAAVPDAENFAANKALMDLDIVLDGEMEKGAPGAQRRRVAEVTAIITWRPSPLGLPRRPDLPYRAAEKAERMDLAAWQDWFAQGEAPLLAERSADPASDVLAVLEEHEAFFRELEEGLDRPAARWASSVPVSAGRSTNGAAVTVLRGLGQVLALRASAQLAAGQAEGALRSVTVLLRLGGMDDPSFVYLLISNPFLNLARCVVWEGMDRRAFDRDALAHLQSVAESVDWGRQWLSSERWVMAVGVSSVRAYAEGGGTGELLWGTPSLEGLFGGGSDGARARSLRNALGHLAPRGWLEQNLAFLVERSVSGWIEPLEAGDWAALRRHLRDLEARIDAGDPGAPYATVAANHFAGKIKYGAKHWLRAQAMNDLLILACALERFWSDRGTYPEALEALVPEYLAGVPEDCMRDGKSGYGYAKTSDGRYRLHSVGWDGADDGGRVALDKKGGVRDTQGDWVWHYSREAEAVEDGAP